MRVGAAKQGGPTVLSMANNKPLGERNSQQATSFKIFSDENSEPGVAGVGRTGAAQASLPSRLDRKENEKTVGPWSGVRAGRAGAALYLLIDPVPHTCPAPSLPLLTL